MSSGFDMVSIGWGIVIFSEGLRFSYPEAARRFTTIQNYLQSELLGL